MAQTSMRRFTDPAVPGLVASPHYLNVILGGLLAPVGGISAGTFACRDTADATGSTVKIPASANDVKLHGLGIVIADQSKATVDGATPTYKAGEDCPVFGYGPGIWAVYTVLPVIDDPAYVFFATAAAGKFTNVSGANQQYLPGAIVRKVYTLFNGTFLALLDTQARVNEDTGATGP